MKTQALRIGLEKTVLGSMQRERLLAGVLDWFVSPLVCVLRSEEGEALFPRP